MSHFGWLNEFGPYISINPTALPLHPCESHAILSTMVDTGVFAGLCQVNYLKQVKKDSDLFNTVCSSRQNRIHRILLSHRKNFMTGLCLFWR